VTYMGFLDDGARKIFEDAGAGGDFDYSVVVK
jgi:hypothetical protein